MSRFICSIIFSTAFFAVVSLLTSTARCEAVSGGATSAIAGSELSSGKTGVELREPPSVVGLELANKHLRELLPLLDHLRVHSSAQYEKAIRDLDRSAKRLEAIHRRDHQLYEISLREWKTRCQIDLLKAKLQVQKSPQDEKRMLDRLRSLREIELERVMRELVLLEDRDRLYEERIRQSHESIERGELRRQQLLEQKQRLIEEPVERHSAVYLKAIHADKKAIPRPAPPIKFSSKKGNP